MLDYGAESEQIVWYNLCVAKEKNHRNGKQNIEDYKVRQHVWNQKVWKKTQTKTKTHLQTLDRAEKQTKNQPNKLAKEIKLLGRISNRYIVSWDTNSKITEILIICYMASADITIVIRMAGLLFKDMHLLTVNWFQKTTSGGNV